MTDPFPDPHAAPRHRYLVWVDLLVFGFVFDALCAPYAGRCVLSRA